LGEPPRRFTARRRAIRYITFTHSFHSCVSAVSLLSLSQSALRARVASLSSFVSRMLGNASAVRPVLQNPLNPFNLCFRHLRKKNKKSTLAETRSFASLPKFYFKNFNPLFALIRDTYYESEAIRNTKSVINKEHIAALKNNNPFALRQLLEQQTTAEDINFILENIGALPTDFEGSFFYAFLEHSEVEIRRSALKNIAKLRHNGQPAPLIKALKTEKNTNLRRGLVATLGKQRKIENTPILLKMLTDEDPKIVGHAIRGLLCLPKNEAIEKQLRPLINHPNEMLRTIIYKEYFARSSARKGGLAHAQSPDFLKNVVVCADVLKAIKSVPDESVHLSFTSPPYYNNKDYSTFASYEAYLAFLDEVFAQTHRITKEGRFLVVNTSPIIIPRVNRAHASRRYPIPFDLHPFLIKQGWEFIDDIVWLKPESTVKNRVAAFSQHRRPLAYKPNAVTEYLMVYRKRTEKLLDWNIRSYAPEIVESSEVGDDYETSNLWRIDPVFSKIHPAVFPAELCRRVIQYYSYQGDLIFDPFAGSGTLGKVAQKLKRHFFMAEKESEYVEYMQTQEELKEGQFFSLADWQAYAAAAK
jgi:DNA modification methylase